MKFAQQPANEPSHLKAVVQHRIDSGASSRHLALRPTVALQKSDDEADAMVIVA